MKKILIIFISIICMSMMEYNTKKPINQLLNVYAGTWQYQNGNQIFILKIWVENNKFMGHYKMITVDSNGLQIGVVYNSRKNYGNGNYSPKFVMYGVYDSQIGLTGIIGDNTITGYDKTKKGDFLMFIHPSSIPLTATWEIREVEELIIGGNGPVTFSIPTNIILTKTSNTVVLD